MPKNSILIDTNLLLDEPAIIFKLAKEYKEVVIPITVLKELDKLKTNPDLSYSARLAINSIRDFKTKHDNQLKLVVNNDDISTNDQRIIRAAKETNSEVATKDISMSIISESVGVKAKLYGNVANGVYDPYLYLTSEDIKGNFSYQQEYLNIDYYKALQKLNKDNKFSKEDWFFIFISTLASGTNYIYANNPVKQILERIDNIPIYRKIYNTKISITALDDYQICAIYGLINSDNVLITGSWGSGKSLISTAFSIVNNKHKKTFISRPPIGIDRRYDVGFLPGSLKDKLESWAMGFLSATYFLYGNTKGQQKQGKTFDYVKEEIFSDKFELIDANSLQGLSLLDDYRFNEYDFK